MGIQEYLQKKGFKKVHKAKKRYNLSIEELVLMLEEFGATEDDSKISDGQDIKQLKLGL